MICHIVKNGEEIFIIYTQAANTGDRYMLLILCLWISISNSFELENTFTIQEFCSGNIYIHNIEPGDPYTLTLRSEPASGNKWYQKSKRKCRQEFKTSNSAAHFKVAISNMNIPSCDGCRCNYFEISVSGYQKKFCGLKEAEYFNSKSDKLSIDFHHGSTLRFDVTLTFTVERNVFIITGNPPESSDSSTFIETPYFPTSYPPNYQAEYILQSNDQASHVLLLFLDFQISHHSFIEVTGNNGTHPTRFYGDIFRPPALVSQSSQLTLKFKSSDDQTGLAGFRAITSFIKNTDSLVVPYTDCGDSKDGRGGFLSIKTHKGFALYDCVWHILPFFPFTKSNLSVSTYLSNVGHKSILEFRCGRNSKSEIIKEINCKIEDCKNHSKEIIVPASEYLYIRFSGYLDLHSVINMTYSTYHIGNCSDQEFKCGNGRCLLSDFQCDGIKHCPDGSDEESCPSAEIKDEKHSPSNVKTENLQTYDAHTKMYIIVLLGCFGLVAVTVSILTFLYNYRRHRTRPSILPQTATRNLLGMQHNLYPVAPHDCDEPPSYEDFIKSSECYPPLLFTRAKQCIFPNGGFTDCTTSFCSNARVRHHSADSFTLRTSDTDSGDIIVNIPQQIPYSDSNQYNVEIIQSNLAFKSSTNTLKRSRSLDSKLSDLVKQDSCHLLLSIVHPVCSHQSAHPPREQWHTLPPNFKMRAFNEINDNRLKGNEPSWLQLDSSVSFSKDRRFTWSFVPRSSNQSELVTVVKTRCFSEPCREISIHCSLT